MIRVTDKQYWMNPTLAANLDNVVYNARHDFSYLILVTGSSKTRVGKTVLTNQVAYYLAHHLKRKFTEDNVMFDSDVLLERGKNSVGQIFTLDEARESITSDKRLKKKSQDLLDFFNEAGMLNHIVIAVMPDYFEINKKLAVGLSDFLINVFTVDKPAVDTERDDISVSKRYRGYYEVWNDKNKRKLYFKGKRNDNDYGVVKSNFWGDFRDFWVIDKEVYEKKKMEFIKRDKTDVEMAVAPRVAKWKGQRDALLEHLSKVHGYTQQKLSDVLDSYGLDCTQKAISVVLSNRKKKKDNINTTGECVNEHKTMVET